MVDRPILRFPDPVPSRRRTGAPRAQPRPRGPGRAPQRRRFQDTFERLATAFDADDPDVVLREDPVGIAPERALVFITAGSVQQFARAASAIGLEVFVEAELEGIEDFPEGFEPPVAVRTLSRTLYATMPTLEAFKQLLSLWGAYQNGEPPPGGAAPWWSVLDLLLELRPWGPEDRLTEGARAVIEDRLPFDENEEVPVELEIWPAAGAEARAGWREETEQRIAVLGGRVIDRSSIEENGFIYEAVLGGLPARAVRDMLDNPAEAGGLATLNGVQFILPRMIGQTSPGDPEGETVDHEPQGEFAVDAPIRAALLDGTPVAGHAMLDDGVVIEDVHDLVPLSAVAQRYHATAMASLILRGDLEGDGRPVKDARLVSVPLLIDTAEGAWTPPNRLFVDLVHSALMQLLGGEDALAAGVFVVNFSIGVKDLRFAGRISALARLLDWWAARESVLFVVSAGNIADNLLLPGVTAGAFEEADVDRRRQTVRVAMQATKHDRTLLAPAEALNALTVGAISRDLNGHAPPHQAGILSLEDDTDSVPQLTSALGLGIHRAIKPDLLGVGGRVEVRALPDGGNAVLRVLDDSQRTGLVAAAPPSGARVTQRSRGTSAAAALTTRAILQSAEALTGEDGPYQGQELPRWMLSLLSRALAVNAARWPADARDFYEEQISQLGAAQHTRAKEETCRYFGHGVIVPELMQRSPETGVTMVGVGSIRKDQAQIFKLPLPASMAADRVPRSMRTTIAWFSPVNAARAQYRLAGLEAIAADGMDAEQDRGWKLNLKSDGPDSNIVKRGSVWSRQMVHRILRVPAFEEGAELPICVQCRDAAGGGLNPDDDIAFALAATLEIEADVQYDIHEEVEQQLRLRLRPDS